MAGGGQGVLKHSSSASGIFFQGDVQNQTSTNSSLSNIVPTSGEINHGVLSSTGNSSGPSVGASSMVTDGNSPLSGGPQFNTDSYLHLPASPLSFTSNTISGSSAPDGSSMIQQSPYEEQMRKRGVSSATSLPALQDPGNLLQPRKKPNLNITEDDISRPQISQQLLQRQENSQMQRHHSPQMQTLMQQKLLQQRHQQQMLQSLPPMHRAQLQRQQQQQQQQQQQLQQQQLQQQVMLQGPYKKQPFDDSIIGICARRHMQYMYHQRHRPRDNNIHYWRKFVAEYFAPHAKKKLCLSSYDNAGNQALGVFPQTAKDAWQCDICGSKSGNGFEAAFEAIPRLSKIKFDSGIIDDLLFLDKPHGCRFSSGIMLLEYKKVTQKSIYDHLHVVREGQLRIIFTPDLKILSWEFCARRHEEFLPRRLVAPQVNQLMQVAHKYQNASNESDSSGLSPHDLQTNCNMFVTAGHQIARNLGMHSVNDLGYPKRLIRCLQISEVVNSMTDVIDFTQERKTGPIESLKILSQNAAAMLRNQKMKMSDHLLNPQNISNYQNTMRNLSPINSSPSTHLNRVQSVPGFLNASPQISKIATNNYQALMKSNSMNLNPSGLQMENGNGMCRIQLQGSVPQNPASLTNTSVNALLAAPQQPLSVKFPQQCNPSSSQVNQNQQQHMIRQMLQEMSNNKGIPQQSLGTPNTDSTVGKEAFGGVLCAGESPLQSSAGSMGNVIQFTSRSSLPNDSASLIANGGNNFQSIPSYSNVMGNNNFQMRQEMPQNFQFKQEISPSFQIKQEMHHSLNAPNLDDIADFTDWDFK